MRLRRTNANLPTMPTPTPTPIAIHTLRRRRQRALSCRNQPNAQHRMLLPEPSRLWLDGGHARRCNAPSASQASAIQPAPTSPEVKCVPAIVVSARSNHNEAQASAEHTCASGCVTGARKHTNERVGSFVGKRASACLPERTRLQSIASIESTSRTRERLRSLAQSVALCRGQCNGTFRTRFLSISLPLLDERLRRICLYLRQAEPSRARRNQCQPLLACYLVCNPATAYLSSLAPARGAYAFGRL